MHFFGHLSGLIVSHLFSEDIHSVVKSFRVYLVLVTLHGFSRVHSVVRNYHESIMSRMLVTVSCSK